MKKIVWFTLLVFALVAAACASAPTPAPKPSAPPTTAPAPTVRPTAKPTAPPPPTATAAPTQAPVAFNETAAEEEGYWYSRYNLGNLVMRSGLGVPFKPDAATVQAMVKAADANPADGDTAAPAKGVTLLQAVYAAGDPHYTQKLVPPDFSTQRWNPDTFDATVTTRAMGWTITKESEWAKQFHVDDHFGTANDNFGAQWRFVGMIMNASAKMQSLYALKNLKNADGLFVNSDGTLDYTGNWVMLEALSDVGGTLQAKTLPHSATNRYYNPEQAKMFLGAADALFEALAQRQPANIEETSLAIQALTWYAAHTANADHRKAAVGRITSLGKALAAEKRTNATEQAWAIRGLIEAYRVTGDDAFVKAAADAFAALAADYDAAHGIFNSQHAYTIDHVAVIMGALNSLRYYAGDAVDQKTVSNIFTHFFLNVVNKSGLQQSVPPIPVAKGKFEQSEPPIFYGYPTIPKPPMAGGPFGIAPVFATEVTFTDGHWSVTDGRFNTAGAMHAANEFIWFHNDEVNGFPELP